MAQANQIYKIVEDLGFVGFKGDANLDGFVDILDVMYLINCILNNCNPEDTISWALNFSSSPDLNILDITKLVYFILFH